MPPPSAADKERTAQLVASLPRREQAELLAQALLREYMHRKGFTSTLAAFDEENPRDERAIASRAIMKRLLNIPVEGRESRLRPPPPAEEERDVRKKGKKGAASAAAAPPAPTFMEELCSYRLTKRDYALHDKERRHLVSLQHQLAEEGRGTPARRQELAERLLELPGDPSDTEMEERKAQAEARRQESREALDRRELFRELQKEAEELDQDIANTAQSSERDDTSDSASEAAADGNDNDSERERKREARRQRKREKKRRDKEERKKEKKAKRKKHKDGMDSFRGDDDGQGTPASADELNGGSAPVSVGSHWAPPGLGGGTSSADPLFHLISPFSSARDGLGGGGGAAAALPERPKFDAGEGVTLLGASGPPISHSSAAAAATTGGAGSSTVNASGGGGGGGGLGVGLGSAGRPLLSRSEITEAWRPGGASKEPAPSQKGFGFSANGSGSSSGSRGAEHHTDAFALGRFSGGGEGKTLQPASAMQQHSYDRSAQPLTSALASSGRYGGSHNNGSARVGVGFNASATAGGGVTRPQPQSALQHQQQPPPTSLSGQPVFRSAVDAVPGSDGLRHGFGFHKSPNASVTSSTAAPSGDGGGEGGRRARKVTLLVD